MPPAPPDGAFDARFASGKMAEAVAPQGGGEAKFPLSISGAVYPVRIGWRPGSAMAGLALTLVSGGDWQRVVPVNGEVTLASTIPGLSVKTGGADALPGSYSLGKNYPNPFNPSTKFEIALPSASSVEIAVFNVLGSRIATIARGEMAAGYHAFEWNGTTDGGAQAGSGVYILRMSAGPYSAAERIVLMK